MQEKIGNVILDYTWYPGEDLYSDGAIEERLLEIARTSAPEDLDAAVAAEADWAVLYHLSHVRENITASLQLTKKTAFWRSEQAAERSREHSRRWPAA